MNKAQHELKRKRLKKYRHHAKIEQEVVRQNRWEKMRMKLRAVT